MNEVAEKLTPSQQAYYRAAMYEDFAMIAVDGEDNGRLGQAKQRLLAEEGETDGNNIAKLLILLCQIHSSATWDRLACDSLAFRRR